MSTPSPFCAVLAIATTALSPAAFGEPISRPQAPAAAASASISPEKLTDPNEIARALATGNARVIVLLSPPAALAQTDFSSRASLAALRPHIRQAQQDVLDRLPLDHVRVGRRFDNIAGFSAEVSVDGLRALQANSQVISIEPVLILQPHLAQGIALMHGMTHRSAFNGAGVAIAICDTGVDYNHPQLGGGGFPNGKVIGGYDIGDNDADPIPNGEAHGTSCAGIAAGALGTNGDYIGGVAYNAKLYALKITSGTGGSATSADMAAAWDWCVTHKDDNSDYPIMVISTSFGGGQYFSTCDSVSEAMTTAADNAVAAGITVLASSGNEGYCDALAWPSCVSSVISVSAVYDAGFGQYLPCVDGASCAPKTRSPGCSTGYYADDITAPDAVTSYANVASFLTLFAPANECYTLDISGSAGYSSGDYASDFGGTSAACPYAAGAVACLQSAAKMLTGNYLTPQDVRDRLTSLGDAVTDTKVDITKPRVNLERLIESIGTNPVLNVASATLIGGNDNQSVDPNECNELRIAVRNDGLSAATNISATLTTSTPGVSVFPQTSPYANLAAGSSGTNTTAFYISTSPSFVCGTPVNLTLVLTYGGGTNTGAVSLVSGEPNYVINLSADASIVPGTTDIGNHGDAGLTVIALPFAYTFYGRAFSNVTISSDGFLQFTGAANDPANACLPVGSFTDSIFAFWDDLRTDGTVGAAQGVYTSTSGAAPDRIFNIEWRASYYHPARKGGPVNFEVRLYENAARFDIVYGVLNGNGSSATVGVQNRATGPFTAFECNSGVLSNGLQLAFETVCADGAGCGFPVASFAAVPVDGAAPLTVVFTNLSSGATSFDWNFGDGNSNSAANPDHTYTEAGSYDVSLTATGPCGISTLTRTNYVVVTAQPQLVVDPAAVDFGLIEPGATAVGAMVVSNAGAGTLEGIAAVAAGPFAILSGATYSLAPSGATNVLINFVPITAGAFSNTVIFSSSGGSATNAISGRAANAPSMTLTVSGSDFAFSFDTVSGVVYQVEYKDSLDEPAWKTLGSVAGDGLMQTITNSVSETSQRFYRLLLQ